MSYILTELVPYLKYAAPPIIGAFIGYLTNRIAIRMLFRPLKAWRVWGVRVPMTPGVIPSKRADLARNMGEVVGDHLLTSKEIGKGLQRITFQEHLHSLIQQRLDSILQKDLGNLASIIPIKFQAYFVIGSKTVSYRLKEQVRSYISSDDFATSIENAIDHRLENFLQREVGSVLSNAERDVIYAFIEKNIAKMFESRAMEEWVEDFLREKAYSTLQQEKTLADILPPSLQELFIQIIEKQTPALLERLAGMVSEPEVRDKIVNGTCTGVEAFIDSLGSMSDMARNFLPMTTVEEKIREYLIEKDDDIVAWLQSENVQERVVTILRERSQSFMQKPIITLIGTDDNSVIEPFCTQFSKHILLLIRSDEVYTTLNSMIRSNIENSIESGAVSIRRVLGELVGEQTMLSGKSWVKNEVRTLLQSSETAETIDSVVDALFEGLQKKKIGKLANIIPAGIKDGVAGTLQKMVSVMLADEVPGLVQTLNIRNIVIERVNSLDLLQLERLLLSIMEEQFKYINLFGALLGFLLGCLNLLFLYGV